MKNFLQKYSLALKYLLFFFIASSLIVTLSKVIEHERIESLLEYQTDLTKALYDNIISEYDGFSQLVYHNNIDKDNILEIYSKAEESPDETRKKLYGALIDLYNHMDRFRLKQLHFHLKNNDSFLRFHRPQKYGDSLTKIRPTVKYVNDNRKPISGFEEGRIFNGYRFVFPLFYKDNYLGSVETSISMKSITDELAKILDEEVSFVIDQSVVDKKVFKGEHSNYVESPSFPGHYYEKAIHKQDGLIDKLLFGESYLIQVEHNYETKVDAYSFYRTYNGNYYIVTILPITQAITKGHVAHIIVAKESLEIQQIVEQHFNSVVVMIVLLAFMFYFLFQSNQRQKIIQKQSRQLKSYIEKLSEAQKIAKLGSWEFDVLQNSLIWNEEVYKIFGEKPYSFEPSYEKFISYIHPEDMERVNSAYQNSLENKTEYDIRHRIIRSDGSIKVVDEKAHHEFDKYGAVVKSIGTVQDVTKEQELLERLQSEQKRYQSILELSSDGVHLVGLDGKLYEYSDTFLEMLGVDREEAQGLYVYDWDDAIQKEKITDTIKDLINHPRSFETLHKRKNGSTYIAQINAKGIEIDGKVYLYASARDITEQKKEEEAVRAKLQKFIDTQSNIVILTDGKDLKYINKSFLDFFGYESLEMFHQDNDCICDRFIEITDFFILLRYRRMKYIG